MRKFGRHACCCTATGPKTWTELINRYCAGTCPLVRVTEFQMNPTFFRSALLLPHELLARALWYSSSAPSQRRACRLGGRVAECMRRNQHYISHAVVDCAVVMLAE